MDEPLDPFIHPSGGVYDRLAEGDLLWRQLLRMDPGQAALCVLDAQRLSDRDVRTIVFRLLADARAGRAAVERKSAHAAGQTS